MGGMDGMIKALSSNHEKKTTPCNKALLRPHFLGGRLLEGL